MRLISVYRSLAMGFVLFSLYLNQSPSYVKILVLLWYRHCSEFSQLLVFSFSIHKLFKFCFNFETKVAKYKIRNFHSPEPSWQWATKRWCPGHLTDFLLKTSAPPLGLVHWPSDSAPGSLINGIITITRTRRRRRSRLSNVLWSKNSFSSESYLALAS